jgi:hypothetical protein
LAAFEILHNILFIGKFELAGCLRRNIFIVYIKSQLEKPALASGLF